MSLIDTAGVQYDSQQQTLDPGVFAGGAPGGYNGDMNQAGAAADPYAYTGGSWMTPWAGRFSSSGYGGGYSVPEFTPFNYADFGYNAPSAGRFTENYADPNAFRFADFQGPSDFKAPTAEDMKADPGYQARMDAVKNAQVAGAAHGGALRTGGFQKGLAQAVGNQASQEYGNTYNRRASEHDRLRKEAEGNYGINQGNTKQAFDTNTANQLAAYNTRQNTWAGNANVALQEGQLGYNIAQGTWDRNMAKARQGYDDAASHANAVASAGAANANQSYQRDLDDYMRSRDEFWTNQDRQYAIYDNEMDRGYAAATRFGDQMMGAYGAMGDQAVGRGDTRASAEMAQRSPWGGVLDTVGGGLLYGAANMQPRAPQGPIQGTGTPIGNRAPMPGANGGTYAGNMRGGQMVGSQLSPLASRPMTGNYGPR